MNDEFPDGMRRWNWALGGLDGINSVECLAQRGSMPRLAIRGAPKLIDKMLDDRCHCEF
jgi:hypothetical protein